MPATPPLFILGEAYGEHEDKLKAAFVGPSGAGLLRMLSEARIISLSKLDRLHLNKFWETSQGKYVDLVWAAHPELYRTNVFNIHPPRNDLSWFCGPKTMAIPGYPSLLGGTHGYVREEFQPELDRLRDAIFTRNPNLILCLGATSLWSLAGITSIKNWRGATINSTHCVADFKLLPTYHPAYISRAYSDRPILIADLIKARRELAFPELRRPQRDIWIEPGIGDIQNFILQYIKSNRILSCDIETNGTRITCIGFGYSDVAIVIPFDDERRKDKNYWPSIEDERTCWGLIRDVLEDPDIHKLFQNGLYDIAFLWRAMKITVRGAVHDTMLLHHAIQPEMEKKLAFLGSIYTDECRWKNLAVRKKTIKRED